MKICEVIIKPLGGLGTPLMGDTLFGSFCWQAANDPALLTGGLEHWIALYPEKPFAVFSSAWPCLGPVSERKYALKKPDLPLEYLLNKTRDEGVKRYDEAKELKSKRWALVDNDFDLSLANLYLLDDEELMAIAAKNASPDIRRALLQHGETNFQTLETRPHNTINRQTWTTGTGMFAPFVQEANYYFPETELAVFVVLDEEATDAERIAMGMERIGRFGFGRDASTGLGRFEVTGMREITMSDRKGVSACYTLGPCVPEQDSYENAYFKPFVRFGKHGDRLATGPNPFKNPVIMADQGAVLVPRQASAMEKSYIGRSVTGVSLAQPEAVTQGYAVFLPLKLEAPNEE